MQSLPSGSMRLLFAFLKMIRWLNLMFIALTQYLFQYCIVRRIFRSEGMETPYSDIDFSLLVLSSVLIAAAGYIINDYFDLNIDRINKPDKMVVDTIIKRRWAIMWHWILSLIGIFIGFYLGWKLRIFWLGFANIICVAALWFYSTTFKKKLLSGNIIISLLTAWVVLVVGFTTHYRIMSDSLLIQSIDRSKLLRLTFLYAAFAFIISLVREVIKDVEDMEGDRRYGCHTMPIVWGVHVSKVFAGTWLVVLAGAILMLTAYVLQLGWWWTAAYCFLCVGVPLLITLLKLGRAKSSGDFHSLSGWVKLVMFTGILSMILLMIY